MLIEQDRSLKKVHTEEGLGGQNWTSVECKYRGRYSREEPLPLAFPVPAHTYLGTPYQSVTDTSALRYTQSVINTLAHAHYIYTHYKYTL